MALPNQINPSTPLGTDAKKFGDDQIRGIKQFLVDLFGIPTATQINAAPFTIGTDGSISALNKINSPVLVGAAADPFVTLGLVVNQGANNDLIGAFQSSNVAQPVTDAFSSSTFGALGRVGSNSGGLAVYGITDTLGIPALVMHGIVAAANSVKTFQAQPAVLVAANKSNGATGTNVLGGTENLFGAANGLGNVVFLLDANGATRIRPGESGISPNVDYDDLVVEGQLNVPAGISILTPSNNQPAFVVFGDPQDNDAGRVGYDHNTDTMALVAGGSTVYAATNNGTALQAGGVSSINLTVSLFNAAVAGTGALTLSATQLTATVGGVQRLLVQPTQVCVGTAVGNAYSAQGLTIGQGAADNTPGLTMESDQNPHAITDQASAKTYATIAQGIGGGGILRGFTPGNTAMRVLGIVHTANALKSVAATAPVTLNAYKRFGDDAQAMGANENVACVQNGTTTRWIVDTEGDMHFAGTSNASAFDTYDDVALLTAARASLMPEGHDFKSRFADWINEYAPVLAEAKIITYNEDGNHFVSHKGLTGLMIDTIRQLAQRVEQLEAALL